VEPVLSAPRPGASRQAVQHEQRRLLPPEEYAAGYLPGAVNIPIQELQRRLGGLPKRKEVVAYCRGPSCVMSYDAVQFLRNQGLKARRLEAGLPEWRHAGLPIER
jgi:rhodanese-related sulfurtransferase